MTVANIKKHLDFFPPTQPGFHNIIKAHGREFTWDASSFQGKAGGQKQCYKNAAKAVQANKNLTYCEGYISLHGIPIEHAWTVDQNNHVHDPTIQNEKGIQGYYGVPIKRDYLNKTLSKTKTWGIFDHNNRDMLTQDKGEYLQENHLCSFTNFLIEAYRGRLRRPRKLRPIIRMTPAERARKEKDDADYKDSFEWRLHTGKILMKHYDTLPKELRDEVKYLNARYDTPAIAHQYEKNHQKDPETAIEKTIHYIRDKKNWTRM